jgi:ribose-phosphate pyrophosphokinase
MVEINGVYIGTENYPNKETIFRSIEKNSTEEININFKYENDSDITGLIITKKYIDDIAPDAEVNLTMKYIPYSRMDRYIEGYMFTLKYFAQIINDLNFNNIFVLDPHSSVSTAVINKVREIPIQPYIDRIIRDNNIDYVFYPDNGAYKKYPEKIKLPESIEYFYGNKKRNLKTGYIEKYELVNAPELRDKNVLIIDDLCSKGMTFFLSGKEIKNRGAKNVYLYVSHLEESIKQGKLLNTDIIEKIYTSDSMLADYEDSKICLIRINL